MASGMYPGSSSLEVSDFRRARRCARRARGRSRTVDDRLPGSGAAGKFGKALTGTVTTTMSLVAPPPARRRGHPRPQFRARFPDVSGPRRLPSAPPGPPPRSAGRHDHSAPVSPLPINSHIHHLLSVSLQKSRSLVGFRIPFRIPGSLSSAGAEGPSHLTRSTSRPGSEGSPQRVQQVVRLDAGFSSD